MTLVADLADRGENPTGGDDPRFMLEVDNENGVAVVVFHEPLQFHRELAEADWERFDSPATRAGVNAWSTLVDQNGYLTAAAETALIAEAKLLIAEHGGGDVTIDTTQTYDDEVEFAWEIAIPFNQGEAYDAWLDRVGWPVVATLINATDPGTFNFPYLFSAILYREV